MSPIAFEVLIIVFLTILNGLFAMSEIAVVSSRKARLQRRAEAGSAAARAALHIANTPSDFLSTVQVGMTLIGVLAGAFGGATIAEQLADYLSAYAQIAPYAETIGLTIVVLGITYLVLILGELVPKRIALNNPERIASWVAVPMRFLSKVASPAVRFLTASTDFVLWLFRIRPSTEPPVTQEEINILIDQGTRAGIFELAEQNMVENVFRLASRRVGAIMTPRTEIVTLFTDSSADDVRRKIANTGHSRYLLCEGSLDNVVGVVFTKDLLAQSLDGRPLNLKSALRTPLFIPERTPAMKVLDLFKGSGNHIALVIDEHGGLEGLVTLNDILEAVVGPLSQLSTPMAMRREDGSWLVDGMLPIDEFRRLFKIAHLSAKDRKSYETLGGFILVHLGRIPQTGDRFEVERHQFEVVDMDGLRADKVLVIPPRRINEDGGVHRMRSLIGK